MEAQLEIGPLWIQLRLYKMKKKLLGLMFLSSLLLQSIHFIVSWWEQAVSILQGWFHPTMKQETGMFSFPGSKWVHIAISEIIPRTITCYSRCWTTHIHNALTFNSAWGKKVKEKLFPIGELFNKGVKEMAVAEQ